MSNPVPTERDEHAKRAAIVQQCQALNREGLNQGTSGNISLRHGEGLLISPTSMAYDAMTPEDIVFLDAEGVPQGHNAPSSEWRFHRDILAARPDVDAVVHAHPPFATIIAILGRDIPPLHYMIAVCGGANIRCAPYALFGTGELSDHAVAALEERTACLLDHHGMIALGTTLEKAMWRAVEVEALARQYHACLALGAEPPLLSQQQIDEVLAKIQGYGLA